MPPNPLKPLIKGMFAMLFLAAALIFVFVVRSAISEEQNRATANRKRIEESQRQVKAEQDRIRTEVARKEQELKLRREQQAAEARAKERTVDVGAAFGDLRRKAEGGDPDAQYLLGRIYAVGMQRVFIKPPEGRTGMGYATRLVVALTGEDPISPTARGLRFASIPVIPANPDEATRWYERAALQGHRQAQCSLGQKFLLRPDPSDGYYWTLLAAEPMFLPSEAKLSDFTPELLRTMQKHGKDRMTPEQVAEAEKRAKAFKPKKERP